MNRQLKVRTGCSVCKIRRVKCDETKPSCIKCTSTGRTCEGYAPPPPRKPRTRRSKYDVLQIRLVHSIDASFDTPDVGVILNSDVSDPAYPWRVPRSLNRVRNRVDQDESRGLAYYRTRVSNGISSFFDIDFWNTLVLQVGEEEPVVRHAILALSSLYEAGETSQLLRHPSSNDRYNFLMRFAVSQYTKALSMLSKRTDTDGSTLEVIMISCLVFTWIEFLRGNVDDALTHLQSGIRILSDQRQLATPQKVVKHVAHILAQIHDLYQWKGAFQKLRDRLDIDALTADALQALHQLELWYLLTSNTLETLFATTPMVFDKYNDTYARMVYLSRRILQNQILRQSKSLFRLPFENGIQRVLFYIVHRCRHLPIRREAVQLLQLCPDQKGIWQRANLVAFCNWKTGVEEKGRPQGALDTDPLPENARVYAEKAREITRDGQSLMVIRFKRGASNRASDAGYDEEEVTNLSMRLAGLLRTWGSLSLFLAG
ncbi:Transcriptional regulatory moc3 [Pyrenophora seminiperda CCB06]|uniref:Transcriptional regulatory moc3 n=1 Tax=Pyrenophora seminiperda CCB06 TaxID=1302712 RepID=A0A3M7LVN8_9PLEO|nr:Transcriptional regulatory moc3 [Pyrenophora seminiperda CCB06]